MNYSGGRIAILCAILFLGSAFLTLSFRQTDVRASWPDFSSSTSLSGQTADPNKPKVAFATFLAGTSHSDPDAPPEDDDKDGYYVGARVLAYQLLHSASAGTNASIPFLVLVTEDVHPRKRERLTKDGATVVLVEKLQANWDWSKITARWRDVLTKLRLFEMTEYSKICFIDADHLVTARLDGVFLDEATLLRTTKADPEYVKGDEAPLPQTYMFASKPEAYGYDHPYPPPDGDYFNVGFFVFTPNKDLFNYYVSLLPLSLQGRYDPSFPEQNLLNYAHRKEGNMPWGRLFYGWNMNWPTIKDMEGGARSFHAKFWDDDPGHDPKLKEIWWRQRAEMEGFQRGREVVMKEVKKGKFW